MLYQDVLVSAIQLLLDADLPDEAFTLAFTDRAGLMAGLDPEEVDCHCND